jgi:hypothetical protein
VPAPALRLLPSATWFRIERAIEGSDTAVVMLAAQPVARSSGGRSIVMGSDARQVTWTGAHDRTRRLGGVRTMAAIGAARWSGSQNVAVGTRFTQVEAGL